MARAVHRTKYTSFWAAAWLCLFAPLLARAAHYTLTPFASPVSGASAVTVTVLNPEGDFGGTYKFRGRSFAYAVYHGRVRTLPPIPGADPRAFVVPTAITQDGTIGGVYGFGDVAGFVYRGGDYVAPLSGPEGFGGTLGLNDSNEAFFTVDTGHETYVSVFGPTTALQPFAPRLKNGGSAITSLNARGSLAGFGQDGYAFACIAFSCAEISPRGVPTASFGTFINDRNQVAGIAGRAPFLLSGGDLRRFALPEDASSATLGGLNNAGTIAGTLIADDGKQRLFTLRNGRYMEFGGARPPRDSVQVFGITAAGDVGVAISHGARVQYYLAKCSGAGC